MVTRNKKTQSTEENPAPARGRIKTKKKENPLDTPPSIIGRKPINATRNQQASEDNSYPSHEPQSFIVQNVMPGPTCISDLGLTFEPFEVVDLTFEDPRYIRASRDLKVALMNQHLRKITREEWDKIIKLDFQREQLAEAKAAEVRKSRKFQVDDDKEIEAEYINLNAADSGVHGNEAVTIRGNTNDPAAYARAFSTMSAEYAAKGMTLDAAEFGKMVQDNPMLIKTMQRQANDGIVSGITGHARATVSVPPLNDGDDPSVASFDMTNFNRDGYLAGAGNVSNQPEMQYDFEDMGVAEEIDLAAEDLGDSPNISGGIKRKG